MASASRQDHEADMRSTRTLALGAALGILAACTNPDGSRSNAKTGAVIGATAGIVIGSLIDDEAGAVVGGALGAAAGAEIGSRMDRSPY
jgi:osmotically inducible lipoprotein OsmB